jgi:hypothetical protein
MCGKRCFTSLEHARRAHRHASWRFRVYWCDDCGAYHVTASEKRRGEREEYDDAQQ